MKKFIFLLIAIPVVTMAQVGYNITSWDFNNTGHQAQYYSSDGITVNNLNDSSEVQQVCYNTDTVYVRANLLAKFIMGPWPGDPFTANGQDNSYIIPRNPTYPSSTHQTKPSGAMGLLINGVIIFDDGDGKSYNTSTGTNSNSGAGVWNQIAWVAHAGEMDSGNGHPDPSSIYHNHSNPIQLCSVTSSTAHSPIIGWSFDGWPIYGPFGYSSATDNTSAIARMTSSWSLRNITTRTTLYTGTSTSQTGPAVSTSFPLGTYIEDYGYTSGAGDLDYYNGRYCVTPEYPSGTYAYFLNTDASANASYPNMIGPKYYGSVFLTNFGTGSGSASAPKSGVSCYTPSTGITATLSASSNVSCYGLSDGSATVSVSGGSGTSTYSWSPSGGSAATASNLAAGTYTCSIINGSSSTTQTVTLTQPTAISVTDVVTSPTCNGGTTGAIDVSVSGGSPNGSLSPGLIISEVLADPAGTDSPFEFVELVATKAIDFSSTPYTVVFANNGTATSNGWKAGAAITYAFEISSGSVTQGEVVYVGGSSMTPTSNVIRSINTGTTAGDGSIGNSNAAGVLGNGGAAADAVAVFSVGTSSLSSSTVPVDAIFYGSSAGTAVVSAGSAGYQLPVNDKYSGGKLQTSSSIAPTSVSGQYLKATGTYNLATSSWTTVRTWANTATFTNLATSVSLTNPYTYTWTNSATTEDISGITGGTYSITVTDGSSCSTIQAITVSQPTAISTSVSQTNVSCSGGSTGSATITASGGTGTLSYSWSPSGGGTATASSLASGTYTCTVTDGNSCTKTQTVTITSPTAISTSVSSQTNVLCNGNSTGAATISVSGGTGTLSYSWLPGGGSAATASGLASGSYTCTVTDGNSCTKTQTVTITAPTAISTSVSSQTNVLCNGNSTGAATISASGGNGSYSYSWSPGGGSAATASNLASGTYTCTITDANLCAATQTVAITAPTTITASVSSQTNVACGGSDGAATISASGGTGTLSYSWSPGGGNAATAINLAAGTYTCTITDANSCAITQAVTITQPTTITSSVSSQANVSCNGNSDGSAAILASGGTGSLSYSWSPSGGSAASVSNLAAGTYTCTITDVNSCSATQTVTITAPAILTASASSTTVLCNGGSSVITVSASGGTSAYTGTGNVTVTAGTYTYTVSDANACSSSTSITVTEPTMLSASATSTTILCNGGTSTVAVSAAGGTSSYTGAGNFTPTAGTYTYTVTDANGCTASTSVILTEPTLLIVSAAPGTIFCNGDSSTVVVSASGGTSTYTGTGSYMTPAGMYTYSVSDANGCSASTVITITEPLAIASAQNITLCFGQSLSVGINTYTSSGVYTDVFTAVSGCDSTVTTSLVVNSAIDVSTTTSSATITANQVGASYQWLDCDNSNVPFAGETGQSFTATANGNYAVAVTTGSCSDTSACVAIVLTGINEKNTDQTISIYPNPNIGLFTIELSSNAQVIISDALGNIMVNEQFIRGKQSFDLGAEKNGIYFVRVLTLANQTISRISIHK